jgi:hypothetical protein
MFRDTAVIFIVLLLLLLLISVFGGAIRHTPVSDTAAGKEGWSFYNSTGQYEQFQDEEDEPDVAGGDMGDMGGMVADSNEGFIDVDESGPPDDGGMAMGDQAIPKEEEENEGAGVEPFSCCGMKSASY